MKKWFGFLFALTLLTFLLLGTALAAEDPPAEHDMLSGTQTISGRLVPDDGSSSIHWASSDGSTPDLYLYDPADPDDRLSSYPITIDSEGNWSADIDGAYTGSYCFAIQVGDVPECNIITGTYYYTAEKHSSTGTDDLRTITLGSGSVTGLEVYVPTCWFLSGEVRLPDGGYFDKPEGEDVEAVVYAVVLNDAGEWGQSYPVSCPLGPDGGSYTIKVPREARSYALWVEPPRTQPSGNIYWITLVKESVWIDGDTAGLDFTFPKTASTVTVTVRLPEGFSGTVNLDVYLLFDPETAPSDLSENYRESVTISSEEGSGTVSISVPSSETRDAYQLCYKVWNGDDGIYTYSRVYLCVDGSLTTVPSLAATFSLEQQTGHTLDLLTKAPFATGKIYCPKGLEEPVTLLVCAQEYGSPLPTSRPDSGYDTVTLDPDGGFQDEHGRFSIYALDEPAFNTGSYYQLVCFSTDTGTPVDTSPYLVRSDGSLTKAMSAFDATSYYSFNPEYPKVVDFTPMLWDTNCEYDLLQSGHGISGTAASTWTYTIPGAVMLTAFFSDRTDVPLVINGTRYEPAKLYENSITVNGDTLTVEMPALESGWRRFGFSVKSVSAAFDEEDPTETCAAAVYTPSGGTGEAILSDVNAGKPVRIILAGQGRDELYDLMGALYDENGILLDLVRVPVAFYSGVYTTDLTTLTFEEYGQAVTLKLFLLDENWAPKMEHCTFTSA